MRINEIFTSIQGEGIHAGEVMTFVRLSGCNLSCVWCDTKYANMVKDRLNSIDINPSARWVCITGGEPLLQADGVAALALKLRSMDKHVEIETNGSILPPPWAFMDVSLPHHNPAPLIDSWVVDIKLPSSGNPSSEGIIKRWLSEMRSSDQIKFVAADDQDLESISYWMNWTHACKAAVLISPVILGSISNMAWMQRIADFCIANNLRLSLQLHKIIWGNKKGV